MALPDEGKVAIRVPRRLDVELAGAPELRVRPSPQSSRRSGSAAAIPMDRSNATAVASRAGGPRPARPRRPVSRSTPRRARSGRVGPARSAHPRGDGALLSARARREHEERGLPAGAVTGWMLSCATLASAAERRAAAPSWHDAVDAHPAPRRPESAPRCRARGIGAGAGARPTRTREHRARVRARIRLRHRIPPCPRSPPCAKWDRGPR